MKKILSMMLTFGLILALAMPAALASDMPTEAQDQPAKAAADTSGGAAKVIAKPVAAPKAAVKAAEPAKPCAKPCDMSKGPMGKLGRGILNIADAVCEIPGTMLRTTKTKGVSYGMTAGAIEGALNTMARTLVGLYEIVTFYLPDPEGYTPVMGDPKFLKTE